MAIAQAEHCLWLMKPLQRYPMDEGLGSQMTWSTTLLNGTVLLSRCSVSVTTYESPALFRPPSSPVSASVFLLPGFIRPCAAAAIFIALVLKPCFLARLQKNSHLHFLTK